MDPLQPNVNIRDFSDNPMPEPPKFKDPEVMEASLTPVQQAVAQQTNEPKEYTLSNGTRVAFKKPSGIVSIFIAKILGNDSFNPALNIYYRMLFCLSAVNGVAIRSPRSALEVEAIAGRLGDEETFAEALAKFHEWADIDMGDEQAKK